MQLIISLCNPSVGTSTLFSGHGFGINTDIFETNVINLAVVITVVITVVGDALKDFLETRKAKIIDNISASDKRVAEIELKLEEAQNKLAKAKEKAIEIEQQGAVAAKEEQALCIQQAEDEAKNLKQRKESSIELQQKKAIQEISKQIISLSLKQAREKATKNSSLKRFQIWVNRARFVHYRTVDKYLKHLV
uniref:ATP synthase subunit b, chloroplastic n=1 Tax=Blidingia minima TaxID=63414 RepID=A0A2Z4M9F6_9CHLO|nr:ATP synthase CF0 subunit I [Blidingia minima]AWX53122.1 AtpF [Blidingia minima]QPF96274.1 ATP synthase CF0 subunit I [Blidingia minima]QUX32852.1 ATP synthase subunit b [Blidingia minima]